MVCQFRRCGVSALVLLVLLGSTLSIPRLGFAQQPARKPVTKAPAKTAATAAPPEPRYKGIWEPVNYSEDLQLTDVFCVSVDVCWVSGAAGTILKTVDGGETWTAQLGGDPNSQEYAISGFRFVDQTRGWVVQYTGGGDYKLLHTTDGEAWEHIGSIRQHYSDHAFTTATTGVQLYDGSIFFTQDAGRKWQEVFTARLKLDVGGLIRETDGRLELVHFPHPDVGYAVSRQLPTGASAIFKTEDGGATWTVASFLPDADAKEGSIFFLDQDTGFIRAGSRLFTTSDGAQTWRSLAASVGWMKFADPSVGWAFWDNNFAYTTDGGTRWSSRAIPFPARPRGFSLPRRDRGYVVGDHGMIYRYRVIPANEPAAANTIPAPAMPLFDSPLDEQVEQLDDVVEDLEEEIAEDQASENATGGEPGWAGTHYAGEIEKLETQIEAVSREVPAFTGKYRNLNLVFSGVQSVGQLFAQTDGLKEALQALRKARDLKSAVAAVTDLAGHAEALSIATRTAFQKQAK